MKEDEERRSDSSFILPPSSFPPSSFPSSCPWPALSPPRDIPLTVLAPHPCSYLPDRIAMNRAFLCKQMPPELYHDLMDAGFRRSGTFIYQPICSGCRECTPIRLPVDQFQPTRSQRRAMRRNHDLVVSVELPSPTDDKFDLYSRYVCDRHHRPEDADHEAFISFLYESPVDTLEFTYRDPAGRLLGVGICDICARSLSSVYFYFDPAESRRGLGMFSLLSEIDFARRQNIPFYYLGYWINGCATMHYKADFGPHELLHPDGVWRLHSLHSESYG